MMNHQICIIDIYLRDAKQLVYKDVAPHMHYWYLICVAKQWIYNDDAPHMYYRYVVRVAKQRVYNDDAPQMHYIYKKYCKTTSFIMMMQHICIIYIYVIRVAKYRVY